MTRLDQIRLYIQSAELDDIAELLTGADIVCHSRDELGCVRDGNGDADCVECARLWLQGSNEKEEQNDK